MMIVPNRSKPILQSPSPSSSRARRWLTQNLLLLLTIGAVFSGVLIGFVGRASEYGSAAEKVQTSRLVGFPGELLMRMLKCIILPLIVSSLITGIARLDVRHVERMGGIAILYYLATTLIAVMTGIVLVMAMHPGNPDMHPGRASEKRDRQEILDTVLDLIRNMFLDNLVQSTMQQAQTRVVNVTRMVNRVNVTVPQYTLIQKDGMNILGLIIFCIIIGVLLGRLGRKAHAMVNFFGAMELVSMQLVGLIMWYSPFGITSLIASKIMGADDLTGMAKSLAMYVLTIVSGLSIHSLLSLPLLYFFLTGRNPFVLVKSMLQAMAIAFGTASSAATLPVSCRCLEQHMGIDRRVTRFVLPVGATMNMDGTALYEAVATIFIAQMNGAALGIDRVIVISLTATLASIGAAAIPHGGLVTIMMVLTAVGLPVEDVALITAIDWLIDRFRTAINVLGDAYGAAIVHHYCKRHLPLELKTGGMPDGEEEDNDDDEESGPSSSSTKLLAMMQQQQQKQNGSANGLLMSKNAVGNGVGGGTPSYFLVNNNDDGISSNSPA